MKCALIFAASAASAAGAGAGEPVLDSAAIASCARAAGAAWTAGPSKFDGLPLAAVRQMMGWHGVGSPAPAAAAPAPEPLGGIPESFDAREQWPDCPTIAEIRDQSMCGSCWAVSAAEAASDRWCIATGESVRMSAADLMSCDTTNDGCLGGVTSNTWNYLYMTGMTSGGAYGDNSLCKAYPFEPCEHHGAVGEYPACGDGEYDTPACVAECDGNSTLGVDYADDLRRFGIPLFVPPGNATAIQLEIMANGPVQTGFNVYESFMSYTEGVYVKLDDDDYLGGHAVKLLGWGTDPDAGDYWTVANSWNSDWGEDVSGPGCFRIARGDDDPSGTQIEMNVVTAVPASV